MATAVRFLNRLAMHHPITNNPKTFTEAVATKLMTKTTLATRKMLIMSAAIARFTTRTRRRTRRENPTEVSISRFSTPAASRNAKSSKLCS